MSTKSEPPLDHPLMPAAGNAEAMLARVTAGVLGVDSNPPEARKIGRFAIVGHAGSGGMGQVLSAYDPNLDRVVALKLLHKEQITDARSRDRLTREARTLAKLAHPNIVACHEVDDIDGSVYVVMEHVQGLSLKQWQSVETRPLGDILRVYAQAALGLMAAHDAGIVHRDFKPSNVLVGDDGRVRVADFGLARLDDAAAEDRDATTAAENRRTTTPSDYLGTPEYMAPEQFALMPIDERTDQFSYCVALWEAVFGSRPWEPRQLRACAAAGTQLPNPATRGGGPPWLRRVLLRGLEVDPGRRWPSMKLLQDELRSGRVRQRRWRAAGAAGLAALAGLLSYHMFDDPCAGISVPAGTWDHGQRELLRGHAASTAPFYPGSLIETLEFRLDSYIEAWVAAREDTCLATYVRRDQSEEQFDRSIACLERSITAFRTVVETLAVSNAATLMEPLGLLDQLPRVEACRETTALRDGASPPGAEVSQSVRDAEAAIDRALVLVAAGRVDEATALLSFAEAAALAAGHQPTEAEALYGMGVALTAKGDIQGGRTRLSDAAAKGIAARHHEVALRAWHRLVILAATDLESPAQAREWVMLARSALELMGSPVVLQAFQADHEGFVASANGDFEGAAEFHAIAEARLSQALSPKDSRLVEVTRHRANALLNAGRTDEAENIYLELRSRVATLFGTRHPGYAAILHNLGLCAQARGDLIAARGFFEMSLDILRSAFGTTSLRIAPSLTALADVARTQGDLLAAEEWAEHAWDIQRSQLPAGHSERAGALALLAAIRVTRRDLTQALDNFRSLAVAFQGGAHLAQLALVHQNIGWVLCELGRCSESRAEIEHVRALAGLAGPDREVISYSEALLARVELEEGDVDGAIRRIEILLPRASELPASMHPELMPELLWTLARAKIARGWPSDREVEIELIERSAHGYAVAGLRPDALGRLDGMRREWFALHDGR